MAAQPGLCGTWSETPKTGFLTTRLISEAQQDDLSQTPEDRFSRNAAQMLYCRQIDRYGDGSREEKVIELAESN